MADRRFCELRAVGGRTLEGVVMRYGEVASLPWGGERFLAGAFGDVGAADVVLNFAHDRTRPLARNGRGLTLSDSPQALTLQATLPPTRDADDALILVQEGVLIGFSVEFRVGKDRVEGGCRIVSEATLTGVGLVDQPAYEEAVVTSLRARLGQEAHDRALLDAWRRGRRW